MKAIYLACGLIMAGQAVAGSTSGSIAVKLVITAACSVDGNHIASSGSPGVSCPTPGQAQPKVTQTVTRSASQTRQENRLITVEW